MNYATRLRRFWNFVRRLRSRIRMTFVFNCRKRFIRKESITTSNRKNLRSGTFSSQHKTNKLIWFKFKLPKFLKPSRILFERFVPWTEQMVCCMPDQYCMRNITKIVLNIVFKSIITLDIWTLDKNKTSHNLLSQSNRSFEYQSNKIKGVQATNMSKGILSTILQIVRRNNGLNMTWNWNSWTDWILMPPSYVLP